MKLITSYKYNEDYSLLCVTVSELGLNAFKNQIYPILKEQNKCKSYNNVLKLYVLLHCMNEYHFLHIDKESLAELAFSKHKDRLEAALNLLIQAGFVQVKANRNNNTTRMYYTYLTSLPDYVEQYPVEKTRAFEYCLPERTRRRLSKRKENTSQVNMHTDNDSLLRTTNKHENNCSIPLIANEQPDNSFRNMFVRWYDELIINGFGGIHGAFSNKDGRFYHRFHQINKEEREQTVIWDNQHVVEVWDAHSAFFIILCYYLLKVKEYNSEEEREAFTKEARCLADFCMTQDLYGHIASYHNRNAPSNSVHFTRDKMKELLHSYCSRSRKYLFRKDGGLKNSWFCQQYQFIDEYFKENYPNIRDLLLDYPRREEIVFEEVWRGGYCIPIPRRKQISNIHRDIMPYEFVVISEGICRILYERYGIKSITVHDAIYMKETEADRKIDIDAILRQIVLSEQPARKSVNLLEGLI